MRAIVLVGCVWSLAATAQSNFAITTAADSTENVHYVNASGCADTVQLMWRYLNPVAGQPTDAFQLWTTQSSTCGDTPMGDDKPLVSVPWVIVNSTRQGTFDVSLADLPLFAGGCPGDTNAELKICGAMPFILGTIGGTTQYASAAPFSIVFDAEPPAPPEITQVTAQDQTVELEFASSYDTVSVVAEVKASGASAFQRVATTVTSSTTVTVSALSNDVEYHVRLVATDVAGNESAPSNEVTATPAGPEEEKRGCSTAPGLLVVLAAAWLRRRRYSE